MKNIEITIKNGQMSEEEKQYYVDKIKSEHPDEGIRKITIEIEDDDYVKVTRESAGRPFDRIRRVTGYLVGTLDRFNDAKRAEESKRVKHSV